MFPHPCCLTFHFLLIQSTFHATAKTTAASVASATAHLAERLGKPKRSACNGQGEEATRYQPRRPSTFSGEERVEEAEFAAPPLSVGPAAAPSAAAAPQPEPAGETGECVTGLGEVSVEEG